MLLDHPDAVAALLARGYAAAGPRIALDFDVTRELYTRDPAALQPIALDSAARWIEQQGATGKVKPTTARLVEISHPHPDLVRIPALVDTELLDPTFTVP